MGFMGRRIGIVSAKGGVGKTIITINLAASLMDFSADVVALDADVKLSGLSLQLGMYYFPVTLNDVLRGGRSVLESLYIHSTGIRIIPASLGMKKGLNLSRLNRVLKDPALDNNIVLIDCPPGLEKNALSVIKACPEAVIVTTPEIPAVADVLKTISLVKKSRGKLLGIIVNRYRRCSEQIKISEIEAACELPVIGVIPEDPQLIKSVFRRVPSVIASPYSRSSLEFKRIASLIAGEKFRPPKYPMLRRMLWKARR
jgi:septum site-determining protein MinD